MPNDDELVLTRRTDRRRAEERTSRHHSTDCPERLSIASCRLAGPLPHHRLPIREFLYNREGYHERTASLRKESGDPGIIHCCPAISFPFITVTLWPRPARPPSCLPALQLRLPPPPLPRLSISTLPIFGLESIEPQDHQREKRTIAFGPNHHRAGRGYQVDGGTSEEFQSVRPIDITTAP